MQWEIGYTPCMENDLLLRGVEKVLPLPLAESKLRGGKKMRVYLGIDPTGAKLHLGHSVPLRKLKAFADAGHDVVFLVGSFTAMIGDPSGRDAMREPLTREQVQANFETYKQQAEKILDFSKVEIRYNHEWLEKLSFEEVIRLASNVTVQQMLERDMFERRIAEGKPIAVHEFFYPLMVGYDSVVLDVDVELGGSDQEFNMLCGRHLQQAFGKRDKFVLTTRLIEGTDGRKMSKTYDNCVYLTDAPADMYGKIMSIKDELIVTYMECCTDLPMAQIEQVKEAMKSKSVNPKEPKMLLARTIVAQYHGDVAAAQAEQQFVAVFSEGKMPSDMPEVIVPAGKNLLEILIGEGLVSSKSDARRLIEQKGITLNDVPVTALETSAEQGIVRVGKRKFLRIVIPNS